VSVKTESGTRPYKPTLLAELACVDPGNGSAGNTRRERGAATARSSTLDNRTTCDISISPVRELPMDKGRKGAHSELIACAWLLDQGYDVYRNVSPVGMVDIIAIKGDEHLKIDVKTAVLRAPAVHRSYPSSSLRSA
jgi:hypothetical protein